MLPNMRTIQIPDFKLIMLIVYLAAEVYYVIIVLMTAIAIVVKITLLLVIPIKGEGHMTFQ